MPISQDLHEIQDHTNKGPIISRLSLSESNVQLSKYYPDYVAPLPGASNDMPVLVCFQLHMVWQKAWMTVICGSLRFANLLNRSCPHIFNNFHIYCNPLLWKRWVTHLKNSVDSGNGVTLIDISLRDYFKSGYNFEKILKIRIGLSHLVDLFLKWKLRSLWLVDENLDRSWRGALLCPTEMVLELLTQTSFSAASRVRFVRRWDGTGLASGAAAARGGGHSGGAPAPHPRPASASPSSCLRAPPRPPPCTLPAEAASNGMLPLSALTWTGQYRARGYGGVASTMQPAPSTWLGNAISKVGSAYSAYSIWTYLFCIFFTYFAYFGTNSKLFFNLRYFAYLFCISCICFTRHILCILFCIFVCIFCIYYIFICIFFAYSLYIIYIFYCILYCIFCILCIS